MVNQAPAPGLRSEVTQLLRDHKDRTGKSQADIANGSWLDESYVSRLFSGERQRPSREAVILLAGWGLSLSVEDTDELLLAAGYAPLVSPRTLR
jgi:hypothetical protein